MEEKGLKLFQRDFRPIDEYAINKINRSAEYGFIFVKSLENKDLLKKIHEHSLKYSPIYKIKGDGDEITTYYIIYEELVVNFIKIINYLVDNAMAFQYVVDIESFDIKLLDFYCNTYPGTHAERIKRKELGEIFLDE